MELKNNKFIIGSALAVMILTAIVIVWIMAKNLKTDQSKDRFKLTKDYKTFKELEYKYDETRGQKVYMQLCSQCHRADGTGTMMVPPLKNADILASSEKTLKIIVKGLRGEIVRNNKTYNSVMPGFKVIPHEDLAHVINYVRMGFGSAEYVEVTPVDVITSKVEALTRKRAYTEDEL